jgi:hypothetical protein
VGVEEGAIEVEDNEGGHGNGGGNSASGTGAIGLQLRDGRSILRQGLKIRSQGFPRNAQSP